MDGDAAAQRLEGDRAPVDHVQVVRKRRQPQPGRERRHAQGRARASGVEARGSDTDGVGQEQTGRRNRGVEMGFVGAAEGAEIEDTPPDHHGEEQRTVEASSGAERTHELDDESDRVGCVERRPEPELERDEPETDLPEGPARRPLERRDRQALEPRHLQRPDHDLPPQGFQAHARREVRHHRQHHGRDADRVPGGVPAQRAPAGPRGERARRDPDAHRRGGVEAEHERQTRERTGREHPAHSPRPQPLREAPQRERAEDEIAIAEEQMRSVRVGRRHRHERGPEQGEARRRDPATERVERRAQRDGEGRVEDPREQDARGGDAVGDPGG